MNAWLVALLAFVVGAGLVFGLFTAVLRLPEALLRRRVQQRISGVADDLVSNAAPASTLIKGHVEGPLPVLDRLVRGTVQGTALRGWIEQSGVRVSVSALILLSIGSALGVWLIVALLTHHFWTQVTAAAAGMVLPMAALKRKRTMRLRKFEEQFPEGLDLMSRALRAGHAFTTGLKMVADEVEAPVGPEFRKTFDEQNFGMPLKDALNNLSERVPLLDVRFFATAVLIQRETGGNLGEILENLAHVVRERFKILRQVRVHTAHGRLTGYVLLALPAALAVALMFINPDHMNLLFRERMGQTMLLVAMLMQFAGYLWIRKIVKIEV